MNNLNVGIKVALLIMMLMFLYLFSVTFFPIQSVGNEHAKTVVPYFLGVFTTLIGVYWGTSSKNQDHPTPLISKVDEAAIEAAKIEAVKAVEVSKVNTEEVK